MKFRILIILFLCLLIIPCFGNSLKSGEYYFIESKKAVLPVWVKGNINSKVFVVYLHGGPGGSGISSGLWDVFSIIQNNFSVVYWDQRGGGVTSGNPPVETLTIEQTSADIDLVIKSIKLRYGMQSKIFLMAHSFGGAIGIEYLLNRKNQKKVSGWIQIDGSHNEERSRYLSIQWVLDNLIQDNKESTSSEISELIEVYKKLPNSPPYFKSKMEANRHYGLIGKYKGWIHEKNNDPGFKIKYVFFSPLNMNYIYNSSNLAKKWQEYYPNYSSKLKGIKIPCYFLHGKYDGDIPVAMLDDALASIKGYDPEKITKDELQQIKEDNTDLVEFYIFDKSAHSPHREEPDLFSLKVIEFINKYK